MEVIETLLAVVLVALVVRILILGLFVFRMRYDEVAGIVAGACGNPTILRTSSRRRTGQTSATR